MFIDIGGTVSSPQQLSAVAAAKEKQIAEQKFTETQSVTKSDETYFSPVVKIDAEAQKAFFIYRDTETGEVKQQFPPEQVSESYLRSATDAPNTVREIKSESAKAEAVAQEQRAREGKTEDIELKREEVSGESILA